MPELYRTVTDGWYDHRVCEYEHVVSFQKVGVFVVSLVGCIYD